MQSKHYNYKYPNKTCHKEKVENISSQFNTIHLARQ